MKHFLAKISFILVIPTILTSCSVTKNLEDDEYFLTKNTITLNESNNTDEVIKNLIKPKPNSLFVWYPLRLKIHNIANKNPDSTFTPLPTSITPLGVELDPDTGVDLSNTQNEKK